MEAFSQNQKMHGNPKNLPVDEAFKMMSFNGARSLKIDAGEIKEGKLADLCLVNLKDVSMIPGHDLLANLIYSANGSCVDTVICDGKVLMENRKVKGEEEIISNAMKCAKEVV
jgi:5-methylthioadenosine/S-adenosylhomocysteine deaminase